MKALREVIDATRFLAATVEGLDPSVMSNFDDEGQVVMTGVVHNAYMKLQESLSVLAERNDLDEEELRMATFLSDCLHQGKIASQLKLKLGSSQG